MLRIIALTCLTAVAPLAASAQNLSPFASGSFENITADDGTAIAGFFRDQGFDPELGRDSVGDPFLEVALNGSDVTLYFYGCEKGRNCSSIQFYSGYATVGGTDMDVINEWNAGTRYALAYRADNGAARLEYDVFLGNDGVSPTDFAEILAIWARQKRSFEAVIEW